jgi:hypothetical protein
MTILLSFKELQTPPFKEKGRPQLTPMKKKVPLFLEHGFPYEQNIHRLHIQEDVLPIY